MLIYSWYNHYFSTCKYENFYVTNHILKILNFNNIDNVDILATYPQWYIKYVCVYFNVASCSYVCADISDNDIL